jgi:hypothetical protein
VNSNVNVQQDIPKHVPIGTGQSSMHNLSDVAEARRILRSVDV